MVGFHFAYFLGFQLSLSSILINTCVLENYETDRIKDLLTLIILQRKKPTTVDEDLVILDFHL